MDYACGIRSLRVHDLTAACRKLLAAAPSGILGRSTAISRRPVDTGGDRYER